MSYRLYLTKKDQINSEFNQTEFLKLKTADAVLFRIIVSDPKNQYLGSNAECINYYNLSREDFFKVLELSHESFSLGYIKEEYYQNTLAVENIRQNPNIKVISIYSDIVIMSTGQYHLKYSQRIQAIKKFQKKKTPISYLKAVKWYTRTPYYKLDNTFEKKYLSIFDPINIWVGKIWQ